MIRLYDVDGVLLDFTRAVFRMRGTDPEPVTDWDFLTATDKKGLEDPDFWETLRPMPGAEEELYNRRRMFGDHVIAVTAPWLSCKGWGFVRRKLLKKYFGMKPEDVIITSRKDLVIGDWFVDDKPETVRSWRRNNVGVGLLYDQPYNQGSVDLERVRWTV
ncbi:MAG: hypothetical protein GTO22_14395 [Gemmatimonadales bacterium]|nr:hypothetical protein [Gemmatimonadales bacterium]